MRKQSPQDLAKKQEKLILRLQKAQNELDRLKYLMDDHNEIIKKHLGRTGCYKIHLLNSNGELDSTCDMGDLLC